MIRFDEEKQQENVKILREKEEEDLAQILSEKYGVQYVSLTAGQKIEPEALKNIEETTAREAHIVAFAVLGKRLGVGTTTPTHPNTQKVIENLTKKGFEVVVYMISEHSLRAGLNAYESLHKTKESRAGVLAISEENVQHYVETIRSLEDSKKTIEDILVSTDPYHISMVIEAMVASALALNASDIHLEPGEETTLLRFRLDGLLSDVLEFDNKTFNQLVSRTKLLSGLKLNIKNNAQDGRFTISLGEKEVEIRTSILPGDNGESIVMRILNPDAISVTLNELSIHPTILEVIKRELNKPNGMILNTGPTGSGKTTTLYAFLKHVKNPEIKVITIENPIEYHLSGVVQTQTSKGGLTFAEGLRSVVRQDPDVIMIGEIRDSETAKIAVQAALTGHLVFSTLHTNTAAATFSRLIDLGVDPKTLGAAMNVAMAQRLVRKLCEHCKEEVELEGAEKELLTSLLETLPAGIEQPQTSTHFKPVGCSECFGKGYKGRIGIFDIVLVDDELEELLHQKGSPSQREIEEVSRKQGMLTMKADATIKILSGETSLAEVRRVIDL
ncbi:MAG: GspE/PulE family protein [Candidatus Paceibacterota bacterium]